MKHMTRFLIIVPVLLALDQATKLWANSALQNSHIVLIENLLYLELAYNTGAAFSLFSNHPGILTAISSIVAIVVLIWLYQTPPGERLVATALCLILAGAVGNLIDRFRLEKVIDFIRVHISPINWSWPTFNVADSAICIGMALLIYATMFPKKAAQEELETQSTPSAS